MKNFDAVLFDLDGTLLDTAPDLIASCNHTLKSFNLKAQDPTLLMSKVTAGMREMLKLGIDEDKITQYDIEGAMRDEFASYYTNNINVYTKPFLGIESLIDKLTKNDIKTAIITNKYENMALKLMSKFDFAKEFSLILGCDSTKHYKPHPEPLLKAMDELDVKAQRTLYVGDHLNDIKAANAANCYSCVALWGYGVNECIDVNLWNSSYQATDVKDLENIVFT